MAASPQEHADQIPEAKESSEGTIDKAMAACQGNIDRHTSASFRELVVALVLLVLLVAGASVIALRQGADNDSKYMALYGLLKDSNGYLDKKDFYLRDARSQLLASQKAAPSASAASGSKSQEQQRFEFASSEAEQARANVEKAKKDFDSYKPVPQFSEPMLYGVGALFVVVLGIFTGLYRLHMREIVKNEQHRLGFMRIRIAAVNAGRAGFDTEVRTALTKGAFDAPHEESGVLPRRKVESPLPGHPTSDLASSILNRLFEEVDVVLKPKGQQASHP